MMLTIGSMVEGLSKRTVAFASTSGTLVLFSLLGRLTPAYLVGPDSAPSRSSHLLLCALLGIGPHVTFLCCIKDLFCFKVLIYLIYLSLHLTLCLHLLLNFNLLKNRDQLCLTSTPYAKYSVWQISA